MTKLRSFRIAAFKVPFNPISGELDTIGSGGGGILLISLHGTKTNTRITQKKLLTEKNFNWK